MPLGALILTLASQLQWQGSQCPVLPVEPERPSAAPIHVGWHDEFNKVSAWTPLAVDNKPKVSAPVSGAVKLELDKVPDGWPYEYQWSAVERVATVDIARHPYLSANVSQVSGYAHLDIDVLDASNNAVKSFRSTTLQAAGVAFVDFKNQLDPAIYRLRIRLIVGGPNEGCSATYNWIRFTSAADGERLQQNPNRYKLVEDKARLMN